MEPRGSTRALSTGRLRFPGCSMTPTVTDLLAIVHRGWATSSPPWSSWSRCSPSPRRRTPPSSVRAPTPWPSFCCTSSSPSASSSTPSASTGTLRPEIAFVHPVLAVAAARRGARVAVAGQGHADGGRRSPHRRSGPAAAAGPGIDRGYQRSRVALTPYQPRHIGRARWSCPDLSGCTVALRQCANRLSAAVGAA